MRIVNRHFKRSYQEVEKYEAGIVLTGPEVKAIRAGNLLLEKAFGKLIGGQLYLVNAQIHKYQYGNQENYDPTKQRKLLLHRKELTRMATKLQTGGRLTIVPMECYTKGRRIKLSIALARGRGEIAKKKLERAEDMKREEKIEMKEFMKK
ncbi:MAG: SsrA-binding protein [bacterium]|nr:SsrA-binding protein [bacterium]